RRARSRPRIPRCGRAGSCRPWTAGSSPRCPARSATGWTSRSTFPSRERGAGSIEPPESTRADTGSMIQIENLSEVVAYDPERRASQVAFAAAGVRAVVFAFSAGQELAEHRAPAPIPLQALEGELRVAAEGRGVVLRPGSMLHLDAGVPHSVAADAAAKLLLCILQ